VYAYRVQPACTLTLTLNPIFYPSFNPYVPVGGLHQLLHGAWYGQRWSREGLPARTAHLVLDEADALLAGGFREHTERILEVHTLAPTLSLSLTLTRNLLSQ